MSSSRWTRGMRTGDRSARRARISSMASASRRKSSSARRLTANWATISPERIPCPSAVRRWATSATRDRAARSRSMTSSISGRWIFTDDPLAGAQPGRVGLADRRRGERLPVELGEHLVDRGAELRLEHRLDRLARLGRDVVLELGQLIGDSGRHEVDAGGRDLADLDVDAAGLLEHGPEAGAGSLVGRQPRRAGRRSPHGAAVRAARGSGGTTAMRRAERAQRSRRDDEPGLLARGQGAGSGDEVEQDGGRHRRRHGDGEGVQEEPVGAPVPVGQAEGDDAADDPTDDAGGERLGPPPPDTEEAQRHRGRHGREHERGDRTRRRRRRRRPSRPARALGSARTAESEPGLVVDPLDQLGARLERQRPVGVEEEVGRRVVVERELVGDAPAVEQVGARRLAARAAAPRAARTGASRPRRSAPRWRRRCCTPPPGATSPRPPGSRRGPSAARTIPRPAGCRPRRAPTRRGASRGTARSSPRARTGP